VALLVKAFGGSTGTAIRTGIRLAHAGEFGFVLLGPGRWRTSWCRRRCCNRSWRRCSCRCSSRRRLIQQAGRIALRLSSSQEFLQRSLQLQRIASRSLSPRPSRAHPAAMAAAARAWRTCSRAERVPDVADWRLDADRVRQASAAGESVVYGDSIRRDSLLAAGIHRARALVVTFDDTAAALRVLAMVRELAPGLPVLVRTAHEADIDRLMAAGATEVVPEIIEGSLMLASHALALAGVPLGQVQKRVTSVRETRYALLQGFFHGADDDEHRDTIEDAPVHLRAVSVPGEPSRRPTAVRPRDWRTSGSPPWFAVGSVSSIPPADTPLEPGESLVLSGTLEQISAAEADPSVTAEFLTIDDLRFGYGDRPIIDGVSMRFPRGAVVALMGGSGCGKTTILKLIGGQLRPSAGTVRVDGQDVHRLRRNDLFALRRRMGMLFQFGALFTDMTVFDNVAFPLREHTVAAARTDPRIWCCSSCRRSVCAAPRT
jgi:CPA2 family monovalent cation:H+ antiporter-2